jgi:hypothetical protein
MTRIATAAATIATSAYMLVTGCGGPPLHPVSGRVTLNDQPLDEAVIMFVPLEANARKTGGRIEAGRYVVPRDVGLAAGRYRVEIADDPPIDSHGRPGTVPQPARRRLPVMYATESPLIVEIMAGGAAVFDFDLQSSPRQERP